ncbi:hypothetical protein C8R44DRAFT_729715 [Mycena epipterygia]|nr:hypothetical protein C8R44DRAFT_729715 [Mycena epipterygia]
MSGYCGQVLREGDATPCSLTVEFLYSTAVWNREVKSGLRQVPRSWQVVCTASVGICGSSAESMGSSMGLAHIELICSQFVRAAGTHLPLEPSMRTQEIQKEVDHGGQNIDRGPEKTGVRGQRSSKFPGYVTEVKLSRVQKSRENGNIEVPAALQVSPAGCRTTREPETAYHWRFLEEEILEKRIHVAVKKQSET